jgi:predicted enzyme related to lactoylglutathione lyase
MDKKGRIKGLGGVFFKSKDPEKLKEWYTKNLRLETDQYGHLFKWREPDNPSKLGHTQWGIFKQNTEYMKPCTKEFMINFRVENLQELIEELKQNGMQVIGDIESYEYGKFGWVMDPEGNKIELWEPTDEGFEEFEKPNEQTE